MALGIIKNNKHSYRDFGLTIVSKNISTPKKVKIKESVPFMNGAYDFSLIYGEQTYEERDLTYTFNIVSYNKLALTTKVAEIAEWFLNGGATEFYDDAMPGYHFNAECIDFSFKENHKDGQIVVKFTAYPFRIHSNYEGSDIWDEFNFELDMDQETSFTINHSKKVTIVNLGTINVVPEVECTDVLYVHKDKTIYEFQAGNTTNPSFSINKGENVLDIVGTGNIKFKFRREIL